MRRNQDDFNEIWEQLAVGTDGKSLTPVAGRPPSVVPVYAGTFSQSNDSGPSGAGPARDDYAAKWTKFINGFCAESNSCLQRDLATKAPAGSYTNMYIDIRSCVKTSPNCTVIEALSQPVRDGVVTVSMGDEIGIHYSAGNDSTFHQWCQAQIPPVTLADLHCKTWDSCHLNSNFGNASVNPAAYYWSVKYRNAEGIANLKTIVAPFRKLLKNARFGANFSPTGYFVDAITGKQKCLNYIGWTFQVRE
jgi:hypothetical protein